MTQVLDRPRLPENWREWPPPAKMRLRWRLCTDWHPTRPRPNQLTPGVHALCSQPVAVCEAVMREADELGLELDERVEFLAENGHINWLIWLILTGRGWGKTRVGAEDVAKFARENPYARIALVAATFADARDTMVEGESGLLAVLHPTELRGGSETHAWNRSIGELILENGSRFKIFSSEKPGRLRGPQHHRAWCDELAEWENLQLTWDMLMFGLRLGVNPQCVITTTPKPKKLLIDIRDRVASVVTRGKMRENRHNLSQAAIAELEGKYGGTQMGRQELEGELIEEAEGALWTRKLIDEDKAPWGEFPIDMRRVVIAVDPAVTATIHSDETGIIVAGMSSSWCPVCRTFVGHQRHGFVLHDGSGIMESLVWGRRVSDLFFSWKADLVVAETNNGGDLVKTNMLTIDDSLPVKMVNASRGKRLRATPISNLYQQHRIHHIGTQGELNDLEDQMCVWDPEESDDSPDRLDALVYALTELLVGLPAVVRSEARTTALDGRR